MEGWYREQLKKAVPPLIAKWEPLLGVKVNRFFVKRMKTKWGSCNTTAGNIRLNTELAKKPPECLEYIVVHEMTNCGANPQRPLPGADGSVYAEVAVLSGPIKSVAGYEYNMMMIERFKKKMDTPLKAGRHTIEVTTEIEKPAAPGTVTFVVDGREVGKLELKQTVPLAFTASETLDVGIDLGSPVSLDYAERRPFEFDGTIQQVVVNLK